MNVKKIKWVAISILLILISFGFVYFSKVYFFEREERILCKEFLVKNEKVVELIGQIQNVEPNLKGNYVEGYGDEVSGRYGYIISGTLGEKTFFIDWQTSHGRFTVTAVHVVKNDTGKKKLILKIDG